MEYDHIPVFEFLEKDESTKMLYFEAFLKFKGDRI